MNTMDQDDTGSPTGKFGLRSRFPLLRLDSPPVRAGGDGAVAGRDSRRLYRRRGSSALPPYLGPDHVARFQAASRATALVVHRKALIATESGFWIDTFPEDMMSAGFEQLRRANAKGTAFLVTRQHLVANPHFLDSELVAESAFVFDFHADCFREPSGTLPARYEFPAENVFYGESVVESNATPAADDVMIVKLTQPVAGRDPLAIASLNRVAQNQLVALIGYARKQPMSVVTDITNEPSPHVIRFDPRVIQTNVDSFQGTSGSPLLDHNGDVLGVVTEILCDDQNEGTRPTVVDRDVAVASAIRMRVIGDQLRSIGAIIRDDPVA